MELRKDESNKLIVFELMSIYEKKLKMKKDISDIIKLQLYINQLQPGLSTYNLKQELEHQKIKNQWGKIYFSTKSIHTELSLESQASKTDLDQFLNLLRNITALQIKLLTHNKFRSELLGKYKNELLQKQSSLFFELPLLKRRRLIMALSTQAREIINNMDFVINTGALINSQSQNLKDQALTFFGIRAVENHLKAESLLRMKDLSLLLNLRNQWSQWLSSSKRIMPTQQSLSVHVSS